MAKVTAVIDIGSNSARMVVFERSSRFGFHLIKEIKSRVRISEDTYQNGGYLQPIPMQRCFSALKEFLNIAKALKSRKILCVATSAIRDAPNRAEFLKRVRDELKLNIKVIDGEREAYYGALSAINLLPIEDAITIDIGGGSTECALIKDREIKKLVSLNLGTIRLKELFFDRKASIDEVEDFIKKELSKLSEDFESENIVGIGGTIREISKSMMRTYRYPLNSIHGYEYLVQREIDRIDRLVESKVLKLKEFNIKKDRFDTIREGGIIFSILLKLFKAKRVITSRAGVREGLFLSDLLRNSNGKFPANFNVSIRSLLDRFSQDGHNRVINYNSNLALKLFKTLIPLNKLDTKYQIVLKYAVKLSKIGNKLNYYNSNTNGSYFILNNTPYGLTHRERVLIATLLGHMKNSLPKDDDIREFKELLPDLETLRWLSFILNLVEALNSDFTNPDIELNLIDKYIYINCKRELYLAKEIVKKLEKPIALAIIIK